MINEFKKNKLYVKIFIMLQVAIVFRNSNFILK